MCLALVGELSCFIDDKTGKLAYVLPSQPNRNSCIPVLHHKQVFAPAQYYDGSLLTARKARVKTEITAEEHTAE